MSDTGMPVPARRPTETYANRRRPTSKREIEAAQGRDKISRKPISAIKAAQAKKLASELHNADNQSKQQAQQAEPALKGPPVARKPKLLPKPSSKPPVVRSSSQPAAPVAATANQPVHADTEPIDEPVKLTDSASNAVLDKNGASSLDNISEVQPPPSQSDADPVTKDTPTRTLPPPLPRRSDIALSDGVSTEQLTDNVSEAQPQPLQNKADESKLEEDEASTQPPLSPRHAAVQAEVESSSNEPEAPSMPSPSATPPARPPKVRQSSSPSPTDAAERAPRSKRPPPRPPRSAPKLQNASSDNDTASAETPMPPPKSLSVAPPSEVSVKVMAPETDHSSSITDIGDAKSDVAPPPVPQREQSSSDESAPPPPTTSKPALAVPPVAVSTSTRRVHSPPSVPVRNRAEDVQPSTVVDGTASESTEHTENGMPSSTAAEDTSLESTDGASADENGLAQEGIVNYDNADVSHGYAQNIDVASDNVSSTDGDDASGVPDVEDLPEEQGPTVYAPYNQSANDDGDATSSADMHSAKEEKTPKPPPRRPQPPLPTSPSESTSRKPPPPPPSAPDDNEYGIVDLDDVYETVDQHFRDRSATEQQRLLAGEEVLPDASKPDTIVEADHEAVYDSIDKDDFADESEGAASDMPPPLPTPYRPHAKDNSPEVPTPEVDDDGNVVQRAVNVTWWKGKKKPSTAPTEYSELIANFKPPTTALMTVTSTRSVPSKAYAELPFELGEVIEIIQMDDCPPGKWVGRSLGGQAGGTYGFVRCTDVRVDPTQLRALMEATAVRHQVKATSAEGLPLDNAHSAKLGIQMQNSTVSSGRSAAPVPHKESKKIVSIKRQPKPEDLPPPPPTRFPPEELGTYSSIDAEGEEHDDEWASVGSYGTAEPDPPPVPAMREPSTPAAVSSPSVLSAVAEANSDAEGCSDGEADSIYDDVGTANLPNMEEVPPALPAKESTTTTTGGYEQMEPGVFIRPGAIANKQARPSERPRSTVLTGQLKPKRSSSQKKSATSATGTESSHRPRLPPEPEEFSDSSKDVIAKPEGGYDNSRLSNASAASSERSVSNVPQFSGSPATAEDALTVNPEYDLTESAALGESTTDPEEILPEENIDETYGTLDHS